MTDYTNDIKCCICNKKINTDQYWLTSLDQIKHCHPDCLEKQNKDYNRKKTRFELLDFEE